MAIYNKDVIDDLLQELNNKIYANEVVETKIDLPAAAAQYQDLVYKIADTNTLYKCIVNSSGEYEWVDISKNYEKEIEEILEKLNKITGTMTWVGKVTNKASLPVYEIGKDIGKTCFTIDTGVLYIWDGLQWADATRVYKAGTGIKISETGVISTSGVNLTASDGIKITTTTTIPKIQVNLAKDTSLGSKSLIFNDNGQLKLNINTTNGLTDANGKLGIQANTDQFEQTDQLKIKTGPGLMTSTTHGLQTNLGEGLSYDANNKITLDGTIETWTFTAEDGTIFTKKIPVLN